MATITQLVAGALLRVHDAQLDWGELEERRVFIFPDAADWLNGQIANAPSIYSHHLTPAEQADNILADFCAGLAMEIPRKMRCLRHISHGIWELKTLEVRLFGWFYRKDVFVCAAVALADTVKQDQLYETYRDIVIGLRDDLDLDGPKFIAGDNANDIISDSD